MASGYRKSIEVGLKEKVYENNHQLDDYFEHRVLGFTRENKETKSKENFEQHVVLCKDLSALIDRIIEDCQLNEHTVLTKIGLGGGCFLKICLSVFDLIMPYSSTDRPPLAKKLKDSGVKRAIITGIVPDVPENYFNMKRL